ncbi:MAG: hypothetical protein IT330_13085 [Anaerolineae bacterium]|nr:hypothetical protein [Anaerolineae bacterium]
MPDNDAAQIPNSDNYLDDLEDTEQDLQGGLLTIFSQTARHWPLDALTNRTFHFGAQVLARLGAFDGPGSEPLKEMIKRGITQVLLDAAARAGRFHSKGYLRELDAHSPFRFSFLSRLRRRLARQGTSLMTLVEVFAAPLTIPQGGRGAPSPLTPALSPSGRGKAAKRPARGGEGRDRFSAFDPSSGSPRVKA